MAFNCKRLVKEHGKQKLSFISFLLSVPANRFDEIVDSSFWPPETIVGEFVPRDQNKQQKRKSGFRKRQKAKQDRGKRQPQRQQPQRQIGRQ